jgi:hypothetical protein
MHSALRQALISTAISGCCVVLLPQRPASALVVNVDGFDYDVTTIETSYDAFSSIFSTPPSGQMPWWCLAPNTLGVCPAQTPSAQSFATAVGMQFGFPNIRLAGPEKGAKVGPYFAYNSFVLTPGNVVWSWAVPETGGPTGGGSLPFNVLGTDTATFAVARRLPSTDVPSPLPALGAAAAFGYSRKLRKRIYSSRLPE